MRCRCAAGIFHRSAVFSCRTSALLLLTICLPRIRWRKRITPQERKTGGQAFPTLTFRKLDSTRYGGGISCTMTFAMAASAPPPERFVLCQHRGHDWAFSTRTSAKLIK
jgi:hypothetical protein